jgi:hypothetical protein
VRSVSGSDSGISIHCASISHVPSCFCRAVYSYDNTFSESTLKEVKSETFEKLLRALDVKHISGWYHPAMRLQAELHNQEGINAELREQLRLTKLESLSVKSMSERSADFVDSSLANTISAADLVTINNIHQTLQDLFAVGIFVKLYLKRQVITLIILETGTRFSE